MNKRMFTALTIFFMVFVAFGLAGSVSAAKIVDHGTKYTWNGQSGWMKITWNTYQYKYKKTNHYNNDFIKCYATYYVKDPDTKKYVLSWHETFTFAKVTKSTVKITDWTDSELCPGTTITYDKTKLTAAQYYWRVYRHNIIW